MIFVPPVSKGEYICNEIESWETAITDGAWGWLGLAAAYRYPTSEN